MAKLLLITFIQAVISGIRISDDDKEEAFSLKSLLSTHGEFDQSEFNKVLIRKDGLNHILLSDAERIINALGAEFSEIIKVDSIGETWQGRPIHVVSLDATNYFTSESAVQTDDSDKNEAKKSEVDQAAEEALKDLQDVQLLQEDEEEEEEGDPTNKDPKKKEVKKDEKKKEVKKDEKKKEGPKKEEIKEETKSEEKQANPPAILITGAHHARELITIQMVFYTIFKLIQ